jgi:hypothetical protein
MIPSLDVASAVTAKSRLVDQGQQTAHCIRDWPAGAKAETPVSIHHVFPHSAVDYCGLYESLYELDRLSESSGHNTCRASYREPASFRSFPSYYLSHKALDRLNCTALYFCTTKGP